MTTGLGHTTHPLKFGTIEIVGSGDFCPTVINTFLTFLEIITVVATIAVDGLVVEFEDNGTDTVEEEAVVGDHEQCLVTSIQESLKPLDHLKVEVVGGLVEDQQIGFGDQYIGQCHALLLTATELSHRL